MTGVVTSLVPASIGVDVIQQRLKIQDGDLAIGVEVAESLRLSATVEGRQT